MSRIPGEVVVEAAEEVVEAEEVAADAVF